uniref:U7-hexatoxin-Hi1a n=1 Tax=Hadronyche infensa TaxID=153481 RepID=T71A_HADIN
MKTILLFLGVCAVGASMMTGGWTNKDVNDEEVKKLAIFASTKFNEKSNSLVFEKMCKILEAKSQLVAGMLYDITFEASPTVCKKNDKNYVPIYQCPLLPCAPRKI